MAVEMKYGFGPELIPDYKGLAGDTSDHIPASQGGAKEPLICFENSGAPRKICASQDVKESLEETGVGEGALSFRKTGHHR